MWQAHSKQQLVGFAPLISLRDDDIDIDSMISSYNTAVNVTASEILEKGRRKKNTTG